LSLGLLTAAMFLGLQTTAGNAEWIAFSPQEFRDSLGKMPQVLVFTANWCPNCKVLEHTVLNARQMRAWRARYGARFVRADLTRENAPALELLRALGSAGIPCTALFPSGENAHSPLVLRDMYTSNQFSEALERAFRH
jgi:thiol:disulfide interchange protein DsbD